MCVREREKERRLERECVRERDLRRWFFDGKIALKMHSLSLFVALNQSEREIVCFPLKIRNTNHTFALINQMFSGRADQNI